MAAAPPDPHPAALHGGLHDGGRLDLVLWGMDAEYAKQGSANFPLRDGCVLSGRPWRWDTAPSLPYAVSGHGLAAIGAKIYLVGGQFHEG